MPKNRIVLRLFHRFFHRNRNSYSRAYHGVVAHSDKSHHLDVCRDGGGACELCIGMHPAHGVRHTVGSGACSNIVGMQSSTRAAAGSDREILLAVLNAPLLVCACNGMLEPRGVSRVARYRYVNALVAHYRNALIDIICTVTADSRALTV